MKHLEQSETITFLDQEKVTHLFLPLPWKSNTNLTKVFYHSSPAESCFLFFLKCLPWLKLYTIMAISVHNYFGQYQSITDRHSQIYQKRP